MTAIRIFNAVRLPIINNYRTNKQYEIGDIVHSITDDLAYIAKTSNLNTGNPISDPINWEILTESIANKYLLYATDLDPQSHDLVEILGYFNVGDGGEKKGLLLDGFNINEQGNPTQDKGSIHNIPNGNTPVHFSLIVDQPVINGHTFGFQGSFKGADRYRWKPLLKFASQHRLKIVMMSNQTYIFDNVGIIDDEDFFVDIDLCGSTIKRFIDAKTIPLNKQEPILLGTIDKVNISPNIDERILTQNITFTSANNTVESDFTRIHIDTTSSNGNTITANVGDIVIADNRASGVGLSHRLITGSGTADFLEQGFQGSKQTWRDRYFVGTYNPADPDSLINLQKRGVIASEIVNGMIELETISNSTINSENNSLINEFKPGEDLYLFHYKSSYEIGDILEGNVLTEPIDDIRKKSLYRPVNESQWRLTPNEVITDGVTKLIGRNVFALLDEQKNIYTHAIRLYKFDSFKMTNYVYDGERTDKENINLDVNTTSNQTIWYGDQSYPIDWYSFISTSSDFDENVAIRTTGNKFEINNFMHKNNSLYLMIGSPANCNIKKIKIKDGGHFDSGGIYFVGLDETNNKHNLLEVENIVDEDPYFKGIFPGVSSRDYQRTYYRNIEKSGNSTINFGRGEDVIDIRDLSYTNPFSKQNDFSIDSPFLNGRSLPILNGSGYSLLGKYADTGYRRNSRFSIYGVKINELFHKGRYQVDIDPVTGSMGVYQEKTTVQFTKTEDGAGNLVIENSELIGFIEFVGPTNPGNAKFQKVGGMNGQVTNCTLKYHSDIQLSRITGGQTTVIKGLTIVSIDPIELEQDRFYHPTEGLPVSLSANYIEGVKDYVGCSLSIAQLSNSNGFAAYEDALLDPNDYDVTLHRGPYDNGSGGLFTSRSPIKTEIYLGGEEKIVFRKSDLILPFFTDKYNGGVIRSLELDDSQVAKFYENTSGDLNDFNLWAEVTNVTINADGVCEDCETYDRGDKKIVPLFSDLSVSEGNFHTFYRKGLIEVNEDTHETALSPGRYIRGRFSNLSNLNFSLLWRKENEGNDIPPQRVVFKNIQSPFCSITELIPKISEETDPTTTFLFENISNLYLSSGANRTLDNYDSSEFKFSKSQFIFKNVDFVQLANNPGTISILGHDMYWTEIIRYDLISSKDLYPVLKTYEGCRFLNMRRGDGITFAPVTIDNLQIQQGNTFVWIHPQLKRLHLLSSTLNLDLSADGFIHALNNQELEIVIDDTISEFSTDSPQIIHTSNGVEATYTDKGSYLFYVDKPGNRLILKEIKTFPV